jgi:hypothetical protein
LPDDKEREKGYCGQSDWQQQAEPAPRPLLRGFNWPEREIA